MREQRRLASWRDLFLQAVRKRWCSEGICEHVKDMSSTLAFSNYVVTLDNLGTGTTLLAAEQLGRVCYGMEIEPSYCDIVVQRWEQTTGKRAQQL